MRTGEGHRAQPDTDASLATVDGESSVAKKQDRRRRKPSDPIEPRQLLKPLFEVPDQSADQNPLGAGTQLDLAKLVDSDNGVALHSSIMQLLEVDFALIDDIEQRFSGQFDEFHITGSDTRWYFGSVFLGFSSPKGKE